MTWDERVRVVCAMDSSASTVQVLAVFTSADDAQAFADAQPRWYYRRMDVWARRSGTGPLALETDAELRVRIQKSREERALGWQPCLAGKETYALGDYEVKELTLFVTDTPWNPPIATWPPSHPEVVPNAVTLAEPGGLPVEIVNDASPLCARCEDETATIGTFCDGCFYQAHPAPQADEDIPW